MQEISNFSLAQGEKVVRVVRHHPIIVIPHFVICFFILVLDFFLMYYLFMQGWWGVILFSAILFVIAFYCLRIFFLFRKNKFVITNLRVVDFEQAGFFEKFVNEFSIRKIKEVEIRVKGICPSIFKYGNLKLSLIDDIAPFEFYKIPHPALLQQIINKMRERDVETAKEDLVKSDPESLILAEVNMLSDRQKKDLVERIKGELAKSPAGAVDNSREANIGPNSDDEDGI